MRCVAAFLLSIAAYAASEKDLRALLEATSGVVKLPPGTIEISAEIALPEGDRELTVSGASEGTLLKLSPAFRGRALFVVRRARGVRFRSFSIDGNRAALEVRTALPPHDVPFALFTRNNGLLVEESDGVAVEQVEFRNIAGFAVLAARSTNVEVHKARVADSGSRNAIGRNNATGGVLFEEGTAGFRVTDCVFERIRGNAVWTHSLYTSPRNRDGKISGNRFVEIGRDAIQVGHATAVRVVENTGSRIGYPVEVVDAEERGTPVAIDTAGNVDGSVYARNRFEEINGKCIDLDGFHHGEVRGNTCVNRGRAEDYSFGHYGIVMNNTNPDMQSARIVVADNLIRGMKYGGIFIIGSDHRIEGNRLFNLNTSHYADYPGEPDLLRSGIYLGRGAERPAPARRNVVRRNTITGHRMRARCIGLAPGVQRRANTIEANVCRDEP